MTTLANRAVIVHLFKDAIGDDLGGRGQIVSLRVERSRALAVGGGATELMLAVRARGTQYAPGAVDFRFGIAFARTGPAVGMLLLLSEPAEASQPTTSRRSHPSFEGRRP